MQQALPELFALGAGIRAAIAARGSRPTAASWRGALAAAPGCTLLPARGRLVGDRAGARGPQRRGVGDRAGDARRACWSTRVTSSTLRGGTFLVRQPAARAGGLLPKPSDDWSPFSAHNGRCTRPTLTVCLRVAARRPTRRRRARDAVIAVRRRPNRRCPAPTSGDRRARRPAARARCCRRASRRSPACCAWRLRPSRRGGIRIDLADPEGAPLLHRVLAATRGAGECAALADTIALIIERYWREVGYDAPPLAPPTPPPPPPPRRRRHQPPAAAPWRSRAGRRAAAPRGLPSPSAWSAGRRDRRRRPRRRRRHARRLRADRIRRRGTHRHPAVRRRLHRHDHPADTGGAESTFAVSRCAWARYLPIPVGVGQLEPGIGRRLDLHHRRSPGRRRAHRPAVAELLFRPRLCRSPGADLALGWSIASAHHVYLRAAGAGWGRRPVQLRKPEQRTV